MKTRVISWSVSQHSSFTFSALECRGCFWKQNTSLSTEHSSHYGSVVNTRVTSMNTRVSRTEENTWTENLKCWLKVLPTLELWLTNTRVSSSYTKHLRQTLEYWLKVLLTLELYTWNTRVINVLNSKLNTWSRTLECKIKVLSTLEFSHFNTRVSRQIFKLWLNTLITTLEFLEKVRSTLEYIVLTLEFSQS